MRCCCRDHHESASHSSLPTRLLRTSGAPRLAEGTRVEKGHCAIASISKKRPRCGLLLSLLWACGRFPRHGVGGLMFNLLPSLLSLLWAGARCSTTKQKKMTPNTGPAGPQGPYSGGARACRGFLVFMLPNDRHWELGESTGGRCINFRGGNTTCGKPTKKHNRQNGKTTKQ